MLELQINNKNFIVDENMSVIEACKYIGIDIPRFCYHESLSIAGSCRMCLIELEEVEKLVLACLTDVEEDINILTDSLSVKKARENIIEFLLLNHPLDCPICDQGGECDLQDQTKEYGNFSQKIHKNRTPVENKDCGVLIKTIMTRCIHCTRCIRFCTEFIGTSVLGALNRGGGMEIGTYVYPTKDSNISGNLIDLCPVGALTSKSYSFQGRPWELRSIDNIDLTDSLNSPIFVNYKESNIIRILPKTNKKINGNLISDKARFLFDGLRNNRISYSLENQIEKILNWETFLKNYNQILAKNEKILIIINEQIDLNTLNNLKTLTFLNKNIKIRSISRFKENNNINLLSSNVYNFDTLLSDQICFLISTNLETENEVLNAKIRSHSLSQDFLVFNNFKRYNSKVNNYFINFNIIDILNLIEGKSLYLSSFLINQSNILFIFGENFKKRFSKIDEISFFLKNINSSITIYDVHINVNTQSFFFLGGIKSLNLNDLNSNPNIFLFNLVDTLFFQRLIKNVSKKFFYFTSHLPAFKNQFMNLIPVAANQFESSGLYINLQKYIQKANVVLNKSDQLKTFNFIVKNLKVNSLNKKFDFNYLFFIKDLNIHYQDTFKDLNLFFINNFYSKYFNKFTFNKVSLHPLKFSYQNTNTLNHILSNSYLLNYKYIKNYKS
jgi:NADH-quinone oxidoreductase subunit G